MSSIMTGTILLAAQQTAGDLTGVAGWIVNIIERFGSVGVGAVILIENLFPPIPSEAVLPAAGFLAGTGRLGFLAVLIWATAGSVAGALLLYALGALVGAERIAGYWLGDRWGETAAISHWANIGVLIAGLAAVGWWLKGRLGRLASAT